MTRPISGDTNALSRAQAVADPAARDSIVELNLRLQSLITSLSNPRTSAPPLVIETISGLVADGQGAVQVLARKLILNEYEPPQISAEYSAGKLDVAGSVLQSIVQNISGGTAGATTPVVVICGGWSED